MLQKVNCVLTTTVALGLPVLAAAKDTSYRGEVEVIEATVSSREACAAAVVKHRPCTLSGYVFEDRNRDGIRQGEERGIPGVMVSNGEAVVLSGADGHYEIAVPEREGGVDVFMTKPADYEVPLDEQLIPQFSYTHMPEGSPELRFGGIAPTGELPSAVNFPLVRSGHVLSYGQVSERFRVVVSGDTQPYSNNEVGYVRDTLAREVAGTDNVEFVIVEGDVVGDDLGLLPRFKEVMSVSNAPLYLVPGNHDLDFDAKSDAHSLDTFRREFGPAYYSFDVGDVHFVVIDDMSYPCMPAENADGRHEFCDDPENEPTYNGIIDARQMRWLENDLSHVDPDRLIVVNLHIPIVTFTDMEATKHQVDNAAELYGLLADRKVLSFAGHTHTLEQFRPGDVFAGWETALETPAGATPFHQIIAGAACGNWWSGDFTDDGIPMSYQRLGAPRGYMVLDFDGNTYNDRFKGTGKSMSEQMSLSILSPTFVGWYESLLAWLQSDAETRSSVTPVGINDLPDPSIITPSDMALGTYLVANVWNGSVASKVYASFDGGAEVSMDNPQKAQGEGTLELLDPYALERQMYVLRYAIRSESGDPRAQGFELFDGASNVGDPRPLDEWMLTRRSTHLWQVAIPEGLKRGAHTARVRTVDVNGNEYVDLLTFEVLDERPAPNFRSEVFE